MHDGSILVAGVGGLGCLWARRAHDNCSDYADLLLVDADERSFEDARHAHCLPLGDTSSEGCAALPELAESHMRRAKQLTEQMLAPVELLLLLTGLGGGVGTGASHALAAQACCRSPPHRSRTNPPDAIWHRPPCHASRRRLMCACGCRSTD